MMTGLLIATIGLAEAVLYSPAGLASGPASEPAGPVVPSSTTLVAAIVRTGRPIARRRPVAGTVTRRRRIAISGRRRAVPVARRRRPVAGIGTEIEIYLLC